MIEWLIDALGVRQFAAEVDSLNSASLRLLERLGFQRVSLREAADEFKGRVSDEWTLRLDAAAFVRAGAAQAACGAAAGSGDASHPAPRAGAAGDPDAGVGHQLAAVPAGHARGLGVDLSRRVGVRGRRRAADRRAAARPVAGHRAAPLAHHRRRHLLLPGGVEHRQHLFGAADSVGPVGGARFHDAVVVGVDRLGRARRAPGRAAGAGHRAGRRRGGAADVEELRGLRAGAARAWRWACWPASAGRSAR